LSAAAALATFDLLAAPGFVEAARETGCYFMGQLVEMAKDFDCIHEVRGRGLMIGVEFDCAVAPLIGKMLDAGIICGLAGPLVLRFLPPLIVDRTAVDCVVAALRASLEELAW